MDRYTNLSKYWDTNLYNCRIDSGLSVEETQTSGHRAFHPIRFHHAIYDPDWRAGMVSRAGHTNYEANGTMESLNELTEKYSWYPLVL